VAMADWTFIVVLLYPVSATLLQRGGALPRHCRDQRV
jgi:hypothetical protein